MNSLSPKRADGMSGSRVQRKDMTCPLLGGKCGKEVVLELRVKDFILS